MADGVRFPDYGAQVERLVDARDWGGVIAIGTKATRQYPEVGEGWFLLGTGLGGMGRYGEARDALARAAALSPEEPEFHAMLGQVSLQVGAVADAEAAFRAALARVDRPRFRLGLARCLLFREQVGEALAELAAVGPDAAAAEREEAAEVRRLCGTSHFVGEWGSVAVGLLVGCLLLSENSRDPGLAAVGFVWVASAIAYPVFGRRAGPRLTGGHMFQANPVAWLRAKAIEAFVVAGYLPIVAGYWTLRTLFRTGQGSRLPQGAPGSGVQGHGARGRTDGPPPEPAGSSAHRFAGRAVIRAGKIHLDSREFTVGDTLLTIGPGGRVFLGGATWGDAWGFVGADGRVFEGRLQQGDDPADPAVQLVRGRRTALRCDGSTVQADGEELVADLI